MYKILSILFLTLLGPGTTRQSSALDWNPLVEIAVWAEPWLFLEA